MPHQVIISLLQTAVLQAQLETDQALFGQSHSKGHPNGPSNEDVVSRLHRQITGLQVGNPIFLRTLTPPLPTQALAPTAITPPYTTLHPNTTLRRADPRSPSTRVKRKLTLPKNSLTNDLAESGADR